MFQGIAKSEVPIELEFSNIVQHVTDKLKKTYVSTKSVYVKKFTFVEISAHPPGKLNRDISLEETSQKIGSISIKMEINNTNNISFLLFPNKLKISGGVCKELNNSLNDTMLFDKTLKKYIYELCDIFTKFINIYDVSELNICCLNANMRVNAIDDFMTFCKAKLQSNVDFYKVVMPLSNLRGRIGAVKVYPLEGSKCSAHFDGHGRIQFFGFNSVECLYVFSEMIRKLL
jgi:hypothetical protein